MIESDHRVAALAVALYGGTVDGDDVELAVVVAVDQPNPAAHGFHDVLLVGRRNVRDGEACFLGDVFETREGRGRTRFLGLLYWRGRGGPGRSSLSHECCGLQQFRTQEKRPHGKQGSHKQAPIIQRRLRPPGESGRRGCPLMESARIDDREMKRLNRRFPAT